MDKDTITIRICRESHKKLRIFLHKHGLKSVRAVSTALVRTMEEKPEFFIPESMNNHRKSPFPEKTNLDTDNEE